jgi:hypothetical protein
MLHLSPQERNPSQLDPAIDEAMLPALDVQSTILDTSRSASAGYLPHSALELSYGHIRDFKQHR